MEQTRDRTSTEALPFHRVDWRNEQSAASFVENQWETRDRRRVQYECEWYRNIAFYLGHQWISYDKSTHTLRMEDKVPEWRVRLTCNKVAPFVRKFISKFMRQEPTWIAKPATLDPEDIMAASVSSRSLYYYWRRLGMTDQLVDFLTWLGTCGNVFIRPLWDPRKGPEMAFGAEDLVDTYADEPEAQEGLLAGAQKLLSKLLGKKNVSETLTNQGDLDCEICSPFEIDGPFLSFNKFRDWPYLIHSKARSPDYAEEMYGERARNLKPDDASSSTTYFERRIQKLSGPFGFGGSSTALEDDMIVCHEAWIKPCPKYRNGGVIVVANGKVVRPFQEIPYKYVKRIPYLFAGSIPVPGRFWYTSEVSQVIDAQSDYNKTRSQIVEIRNLCSKPKVLCPRTAHLHESAFTSEPGEIVFYTFPFKPEPWYPQAFPENTFRLSLEYDLRDIEDSTAQHEVTNARAPSSIKAGVAIAQLQEQDDTAVAPTQQRVRAILSDLGSMFLQIIAEKVSEDRLITINGRNSETEVLSFKGQSILGKQTPGANYFDVDIELGSQLPMSKAARQQQIGELVRLGVLNAERDAALIRRILGLGAEEPIYDEERLDRSAAWAENLAMSRGEMPMVQRFQNHPVHQEVHRMFQKSPQYSQLSPEIQQNFEMHQDAHSYAMAPQPQPMLDEAGNQIQQPEEMMGQQALPAPEDSPELPPEAAAPELQVPEPDPIRAYLVRQRALEEAIGGQE